MGDPLGRSPRALRHEVLLSCRGWANRLRKQFVRSAEDENMSTLFPSQRLAVGLLLAACLAAVPFAQTRQPFSRIAVTVTPDRSDWTYDVGQPARFRVDVVRDGHQVAGATVKYSIGPEMMPPIVSTSAVVGSTPLMVDGGTMKEPGFLRLIATAEIDGRTYRGVGTAGFAPDRIQPTQVSPPDFDAFWVGERKRLAALPIDAKWTPLPDYGNADVDCSQINLQNVGLTAGTSRLYGILCVPRAAGKYPAVLAVPGAGVRPYRGLAEVARRGVITFQIGIHGIPVIQPQEVYDSLGRGGLSGYWTFGLDSRERYFYRRVYTGTLRANDFLTSLPQWDGRNLGVTGGSQGGALTIVTAGLDRRVTRLAAYYPALSDLTGYLHVRAGGWPHMFRAAADGPDFHRSDAKTATTGYYDVVNFARRVTAPGLYSWGFNDETCPPTSMYAAYNVISAPKRLMLAYDTGHRTTQEQADDVDDWLIQELTGRGTSSAAGRN
jgi:cephalosporin-C deacetylase